MARFILRGLVLELERADVERALRGVAPEDIQVHSVEVNGKKYPVKQALRVTLEAQGKLAQDISRLDFTSADARSILRRLGYRLFELRPAPPRTRR